MAARTQPASPATGGRKTSGLGAHPAREHSVAAGKAARRQAPLESHRDFCAPASRDPVGLLLGQAESRVPELVPVRHGRMLVSPFAYFRGAALPMAADLAGTRSSGLRAQLCGDAHLSNFGAFAAVRRRRTALRISAATTIDRATAVQISHCTTSSVTVFITVWNMPRAVDRTSRRKDALVVMTNVLSEKVPRENAESRSSLDSIEKNRRNSANVTMPVVRATASPCACSAQLITLRVPIAISRPTKASQTRIPRVRIGRLGGSGGRSISPAAGLL